MSSIQDVRSITSPQKSYMWEVEVQGLSSGALQDMSFYAKTVTIPQTAVEQIIINHKAAKSHYAGRDAAAHTVTLTFWDDESQTIGNYFNGWMDLMLNQSTGASSSRDVYAADMLIKLMDAADENITSTIKLQKVFPTDISEVSLSYDASEPVEYSITLSFDLRTIE